MKAFSVILFICTVFPSFGWAADDIYLGGSIVQSNLDAGGAAEAEVREDFIYVDEYTTGFKLLIGYVHHLSPLIDVGIEADYREFGIIDSFANRSEDGSVAAGESRYEQDITAFNFYGLLGVNLGNMGVFAKYGSSYNKADVEAAGNIFDSGFVPTYGVGAKFQLGKIAVRSEYEVIDFKGAGGDYMYMFSIGATAAF